MQMLQEEEIVQVLLRKSDKKYEIHIKRMSASS